MGERERQSERRWLLGGVFPTIQVAREFYQVSVDFFSDDVKSLLSKYLPLSSPQRPKMRSSFSTRITRETTWTPFIWVTSFAPSASTSNAKCVEKGMSDALGAKRITFDEFLPILDEVLADTSSTGVKEDYIEGLKVFDKESTG